jgi:hypothetical protein
MSFEVRVLDAVDRTHHAYLVADQTCARAILRREVAKLS